MPIVDKLFPEGSCTCGRPTNVLHCPNCGSTNCERRLKAPKGTSIELEQHRWWFCKRCYLKFSDVDRAQHCEAPHKELTMRATRVKDKVETVIATMTDEERKTKLTEMFSKLKGGAPK